MRAKIDERRAAQLPGNILVELADGTYLQSETLKFTGADSGWNGSTITYAAAPGAKPVFSGGTLLLGWRQVDPVKNVWQAPVPAGKDVRRLWIDGVAADTAKSRSCSKTDCLITAEGITGASKLGLTGVSDWSDAYADLVVQWRNFQCGISGVSGDTLVMEQPCWKNSGNKTGRVGPAWDSASAATTYESRKNGIRAVSGPIELLDQPGEFSYSSTAKTVSYIPRAGQDMIEAQAITPTTEVLLDLAGTEAQPIQNITISGISFAYSAWDQPFTNDGYAGMQAGMTLTKAEGPTDQAGRYYTQQKPAVHVATGRNITISDANFTRSAGSGLLIEKGSRNVSVRESSFTDLSGGAIYLGDTEPNPAEAMTSGSNLITENAVAGTGKHYTDSVGIWAGYEVGSKIDRNTLQNLPYSGISMGWGWNQPVARNPVSKNNSISFNRVINVMMAEYGMRDGGAIYTQGPNPGTVIEGNYLNRSTANSIYLDEQSSFYTVKNNVSTRAKGSWISNWAGYGINNEAFGNYTDRPFRKMGGRGSTQHDNQLDLTSLPAEAVAIGANAGANAPNQVELLP